MNRKCVIWFAVALTAVVAIGITLTVVAMTPSTPPPPAPPPFTTPPAANADTHPQGLTFYGQDGPMVFTAKSATYSVDERNRLDLTVSCEENRAFGYMATPRITLERLNLNGPIVPGMVVRHPKNVGDEDTETAWASMYIGIHTDPHDVVIEFESQTADGWWVKLTFASEDVNYYDGRAKPQRNSGYAHVRRHTE